ncbi:protein translocase subunit SecF [Micromonospora sp. C28SCA-DRY-2]|uniref:protein translocase subunit SecF n=1 Tax=Micromonospora sp. C28SCA-DRY-2 TaxID=3059522 RepID=UPI0026754BFB|nr:protein translocase subunit SecF [Micromonospora sp. C28SCA-DRY-2]MDO3704166.1 protein translocase subunit SecF [Micromonospora sp. C28SCA-DRY-2]
MAGSGLASRLYRGEAGLNIIGRRKLWFAVAGALILIAVLSVSLRGFSLGIEFAGGNSFQIPASVGTLERAEEQVDAALAEVGDGAEVVTAQKVGGTGGDFYEMRTTQLSAEQANDVKAEIAREFGIDPAQISGNQVSEAWGSQVTERALLGLVIFVALVMVYLVLRFEWRMAVAAVASLVMNLILTAGIYSLVGFEVTPSTIIGFLTILGFALYDVVVVFDKVQENTRGITANNNQTYGEAANLAINQSLMRSLNTSVVALLPVGGLLFIGAGLLGAGTLKDLGLVLFVGMAVAFLTSILLATPLLVLLKNYDPRIQAHTKRVLARRGAVERGEITPKGAPRTGAEAPVEVDPEAAALAGAAPKVGARPTGKRAGGARGGRPAGGGGNRPGGKRR